MKTFKPNDLQKILGTVFNEVQSEGAALISNRSRPDMIMVLESDYSAMKEKNRQLAELVKAQ